MCVWATSDELAGEPGELLALLRMLPYSYQPAREACEINFPVGHYCRGDHVVKGYAQRNGRRNEVIP